MGLVQLLSYFAIAAIIFTIVTYFAKINTGKIYRIVAKQNNNLVLDAAGINPKSGAVVSVFSSNSQKNQAWKFELGNDGYYTIKNFANAYCSQLHTELE